MNARGHRCRGQRGQVECRHDVGGVGESMPKEPGMVGRGSVSTGSPKEDERARRR